MYTMQARKQQHVLSVVYSCAGALTYLHILKHVLGLAQRGDCSLHRAPTQLRAGQVEPARASPGWLFVAKVI